MSTAPRRTVERDAEHTMRWVLAHEPPVVFDDAARAFTTLVQEKTDGAIDVELIMADEYAARRGAGSLSRKELVRSLQRGEIDMAHLYVSALGAFHDPLWAIELPFLFRDYAHAERVFEGPVATRLMEGMSALGLRGLSFAYSGGFRIVPTLERELHSVGDFRGLRVRTSGNPVPEAMYAALGAEARGADLEAIGSMAAAGEIEGAEITYVRFVATGLDRVFPIVNQTNHSLFTTMMVVNERFFGRLSDRQQAAVFEAGQAACRIERETAIREEARTCARLEAEGRRIVRMSPERHDELREAATRVHASFEDRFGTDLLEAIRADGT